jgi:hypothetical protein
VHIKVAIEVTRCRYNYPSMKLVIHCRSFRSFINFHQKSDRLTHDGKPKVNRVVSSVNVKAQAMHLNLNGFKEPNTCITNISSCRRHALHLVVDGEPQWCTMIPFAHHCSNYHCHFQKELLEEPRLPS